MLDLRTALEDVNRELEDARHKYASLQQKIEALEAERHGLDLAIARHNGTVDDLTTANGATKAWQALPRTEAVLEVLAFCPDPLGPAEITKILREHGRDDRRDPVAAALAYLKRQGRVSHVDTGMWTVDRSPIHEDLFGNEDGGP